jgi:hypothetical protein
MQKCRSSKFHVPKGGRVDPPSPGLWREREKGVTKIRKKPQKPEKKNPRSAEVRAAQAGTRNVEFANISVWGVGYTLI